MITNTQCDLKLIIALQLESQRFFFYLKKKADARLLRPWSHSHLFPAKYCYPDISHLGWNAGKELNDKWV